MCQKPYFHSDQRFKKKDKAPVDAWYDACDVSV